MALVECYLVNICCVYMKKVRGDKLKREKKGRNKSWALLREKNRVQLRQVKGRKREEIRMGREGDRKERGDGKERQEK